MLCKAVLHTCTSCITLRSLEQTPVCDHSKKSCQAVPGTFIWHCLIHTCRCCIGYSIWSSNSLNVRMTTQCVTIRIKAIEQYFVCLDAI